MTAQRVEIAVRLLESAREYLYSLLEDLDDDEWFWSPPPDCGKTTLVTGADGSAYQSHIAWQVGHIAMAEYGLMLFRQRGRAEIDLLLMPGSFRKRFARGSKPVSDPAAYPRPAEIRAQLERIHDQVLQEVGNYPDSQLDEALDPPHAAYATKYGAMLMASQHEMLHCGQIGMLRRLMGRDPVR